MARRTRRPQRLSKVLLLLLVIGLIIVIQAACNKESGDTQGQISLVADPIDGGELIGDGSYALGEEITLKAVTNKGWDFISWTEDGVVVSEIQEFTIIVEGEINFVANFRPKQYALSANVEGKGDVIFPEVISHGDVISVKAVAASGHRFAYWTEAGDVVSNDAEYTFTASSDRFLTAVFFEEHFAFELETDAGGMVEEAWSVGPNPTVTLKAIAASGYEFFGWVDLDRNQEVSTNTSYNLSKNGPKRLLARFRPKLVSSDGGNLLAVVGKATTIGKYEPRDLVTLPSHISSKGRRVRQEVAQALELLYQAAKADGVTIDVDSGYRGFQTQHDIFYRYAARDGIFAAERYSARPGQSEHQLGTAVDFGGTPFDYKASFATTQQGAWLLENAYKFGFALSYPKDSEHITGYIYEPWHYRYIGVEMAMEWKESGMVLIEFLKTKNQAN